MLVTDLVCFSHLRWGFVFQRPNHLMARFARKGSRVFFIEEPIADSVFAHLEITEEAPNLWVCTPHVQNGLEPSQLEATLRGLVQHLMSARGIVKPLLWFYTPMALPLARGLKASLVVYDCMDELSGFHGAPRELVERERALFARADLVFTGGQSLFESKRNQHARAYAFPSSVDRDHYLQAREQQQDPSDQAGIPVPRVGYFGVIDERIDLSLLAALAESRPNLHIVMLGPVVKIDESTLPQAPNIHYLGQKKYSDLPRYVAGWQVAMMPFALNEATRYISPTKTLEYLAAGKPIVSTAIRDVVVPYGESGIVQIADESTFPSAVDRALATRAAAHHPACDQVLECTSWDKTWAEMSELISKAIKREAHTEAPQKGDNSCSIISS
jgi:glycosyltransferase involved in cell wall biosynthesis